MSGGDVATLVVSGLAFAMLMPVVVARPRQPLIAPIAFNLLIGLAVCEMLATHAFAQGVGVAGFAATIATIALAAVGRTRRPAPADTLHWEEFEAAFRRYVQQIGMEER